MVIELFGSVLVGIFTGGFLYFIGMMIYFMGYKEVKDNIRKSGVGVFGGLLFAVYFGLSLFGLMKFISTNPILVLISLGILILLLVKYPWWKD